MTGGEPSKLPAVAPANPRRTIGARYRRLLSGIRSPAQKPAAIVEFQPDAIELEERKPPRLARATLYCVAALIVIGLIWASLSRVDTIVVAQGKLTTTSASLVVQPLETSVIRDIRVKIGDVVSQGQVLALLDPTFSQADVDKLRVNLTALEAAVNRLTAELDGQEYTPKNADNPDEALQRRLFLQRKGFFEANVRNFDAQIASAEAILKSSGDEEKLLYQRLETLQSIEAMRTLLADKDLGSKLNVLLSRDARLEVENNLTRIRGARVDYTHRLEKAKADKEVFIRDFHRTAEQELVDSLAKRNSVAEDLKKAELRRQLIELKAPADGIVLDIADRTIGSVVREAETLFVLVPRDVPLQAEVRVDGRDVGQVAVGQPVRLKFEAFPFQKFGTGKGVVRVISEDAFSPNSKSDPATKQLPAVAYYRVLIDVTDMTLRAAPERVRMLPGMAVTAEMKTGDRSVLSYFLYPILRGLDESIREP